ncbi:MAG: inositol monophosphatase family protein [Actinomycetota bacterium]|nr:inositol monophosphatase family protein [Actinomycetota bacterium]
MPATAPSRPVTGKAHPPPVTTNQAVLISRALEVAGRLANDAAEVITATAGRGADPDTKTSPYDWVTDTDRTLQRHTRRVLSGEFPGVPVLGESYGAPDGFEPVPLPGVTGGPELLWVVDPVDGTANYLAGLPWCGYSLALLDADGPLVGVIADPYQAQIYAAARGRGLRANGRVVDPSDSRPVGRPSPLSGALICTELGHPAGWVGMSQLADNCRDAAVGLRVLGSAALAVTQVALGRAAAAVLYRYEVWDVAGALALAAEAGSRITSLTAAVDPLPLHGLVVAAPAVADHVLTLIGC